MIQTNMTKEEIESLEETPKILSISFQIDKGRLTDCKIDSKVFFPNLALHIRSESAIREICTKYDGKGRNVSVGRFHV